MEDIFKYGLAVDMHTCGDFESLVRYLDESRDFLKRQYDDFEGWICVPDYFLKHAGFFFMLGQDDLADECLVRAKDYLKHNVDVPFMAERLAFVRLRVWSMCGKRGKVEDWMRARKGRVVRGNTRKVACQHLVDALAYILTGKVRQALYVLEKDLPSDSLLVVASMRVDYHILKAFAYMATMERTQAFNQMIVALRLGSRMGAVGRFLRWGPWLPALIDAAARSIPEDDEGFTEFVQKVLDACKRSESLEDETPWWQRALSERDDTQLSKREREILECLVENMTAEQIARACFVSKNTVQTHIRSIYNKLGVHNRVDAIERGRRILGA